MHLKSITLFSLMLIFSTGCGPNITNENPTSTPDFVTATLLITQAPQSTTTLISPSPMSSTPLIEGSTTTQINVRSEPSTIGDNLGTITAFSKVQVIGKESNGAWYQIIYSGSANGKGWVTAMYVQINAAVEIPVVQTEAGSGLSVSGLVLHPINVRSGPGISYQSLGTLAANDVVNVIGRDSGNAWLQIEFKSEAGWVASEFLHMNGTDALLVTSNSNQVAATEEIAAAIALPLPAVQDNDSILAPSISVMLSPSGSDAFQFNGNVSSPAGDTEDWLQFTSADPYLTLGVNCSTDALHVELWNNGQYVEGENFSCEQTAELAIKSGETYFLRVLANETNSLQVTQYSLTVKNVR